jgi:uncharacterized protein
MIGVIYKTGFAGLLCLMSLSVEAGPYSASIERFITDFARPVYGDLSAAAIKVERQVETLCKAPDDKNLTLAQQAFKDLAGLWARAEVVRFGPVRDENRLERILFWPDPRSRGLKQVQRRLSKFEPEFTADTMPGKSVAVQGLSALEFILFGYEGARAENFGHNKMTCQMSVAISTNLVRITSDLKTAWGDPDGYTQKLQQFGPQNPLFNSDKEVMQALLRSLSEQLQIMELSKLSALLGKSVQKPRSKRAVFWRSHGSLSNLQGNLQAVLDISQSLKLDDLLPEDEVGLDNSLRFEARQVSSTLNELIEKGQDLASLLSDPTDYERIAYLKFPLQGMGDILANQYPQALGLQLGFNSLDGD